MTLEKLREEQAAAKKKLILGIIFTATGFFLFFLSFLMRVLPIGGAFSLLMILSCFGVGTPFLIMGIVGSAKYGRLVAEAERAMAGGYAPPVAPAAAPYYAPQPQYAPQPEQQYAPQYAPQPEPQYAPQPEQQYAPQYAPQPEQQYAPQPEPQYQQAEQQYQQAEGFVDLDWQKYAPLEAGVSIKPGKDYKFHHADGFVGSVPQKFVDRTFPRCPLCCTNEPYWNIAQHNQMSMKGNLYLFRCSHCGAIISMSMPDVTTLANGAGGIASNPNVGLTNLWYKASKGKKADAVYAVIESVGNSGVTPACEGKEFRLEDLQDMYFRK